MRAQKRGVLDHLTEPVQLRQEAAQPMGGFWGVVIRQKDFSGRVLRSDQRGRAFVRETGAEGERK